MSITSLRRFAVPAVPLFVAFTAACAGRTARPDAALAYGAGVPAEHPQSVECASLEPGAKRLKACRAVLRTDAQNAAAHEGMGVSLYSMGRLEQSLAAFEKAIQIDETNFAAQYGAGIAHARMGRPMDALSHFQRASELREEDAASRMRIGETLQKLGRMEDALGAFREAARREPKNVMTWSHMAVLASKLDRPAEAVSYWQRILHIDLTYFDKVGPIEEQMFEASLRAVGKQEPATLEVFRQTSRR